MLITTQLGILLVVVLLLQLRATRNLNRARAKARLQYIKAQPKRTVKGDYIPRTPKATNHTRLRQGQ